MQPWVAVLVVVFACVVGRAQTNPVLNHADPFITPHPVNGRYLLLATTGRDVTIWSGPTVLTSASTWKTVFTPADGLREIWSPTLWQMDGRWWIYFTGRMPGREHAIYVLESDSDDALGTYRFKGELPLGGRATIDPSLLVVGGVRYLMYVTVDTGANEIHMVRLAGPMQPVGPESLLAKPEAPWEKGAGTTKNYPVDEGPTALYHAGRTFVVFSASDTASPRYCLGLLTFRGGDPLRAANWVKSPGPVFQASPEHGIWAPGRGTFAVSADGADWLLYAAKATDDPTPRARAIRAQRFRWSADGTPDFGVPAKDGPIETSSGLEAVSRSSLGFFDPRAAPERSGVQDRGGGATEELWWRPFHPGLRIVWRCGVRRTRCSTIRWCFAIRWRCAFWA